VTEIDSGTLGPLDDIGPEVDDDADEGGTVRQLRVVLPGDWIAVDGPMIERWRRNAEQVRPELTTALSLVEASAAAFEAQNVVYSAILAQRGSIEALATMACYIVGLPSLPEELSLADRVRDNPPPDVVPDSFEVDTDEQVGGSVRACSLRRAVLEVPARDSVSLSVEYFLPFPERSELLVTTFSTPSVALSEHYKEIFSTIANSIVLT
jgi:hypothetical protein